MGDFYGKGIEIWAGFGPVDITEKKVFGPIMSNFWDHFLQVLSKKKRNGELKALLCPH